MYPPLVLAVVPTPTVVRETLHLCEPIDTIRALPARIRGVVLACNNEKAPDRTTKPLLRIQDYC